MCVYICMYVCMYIYIYIYIYEDGNHVKEVYVCMHVYVCMYTCVLWKCASITQKPAAISDFSYIMYRARNHILKEAKCRMRVSKQSTRPRKSK